MQWTGNGCSTEEPISAGTPVGSVRADSPLGVRNALNETTGRGGASFKAVSVLGEGANAPVDVQVQAAAVERSQSGGPKRFRHPHELDGEVLFNRSIITPSDGGRLSEETSRDIQHLQRSRHGTAFSAPRSARHQRQAVYQLKSNSTGSALRLPPCAANKITEQRRRGLVESQQVL